MIVLCIVQPAFWGRFLLALGRVLPGKVGRFLLIYGEWRAREVVAAAPARLRRLPRKWLAQVLVLAVVLGVVFAGAGVLTAEIAPWWPEITHWAEGSATVVWLGVLLLAVPLLATFLAKLKAAAITCAELRVGDVEARPHIPTVRAVVAVQVMLAGSLGLLAWSTLLCFLAAPPTPVLPGFALILATLAAFSWRSLFRFYVRAGAVPPHPN